MKSKRPVKNMETLDIDREDLNDDQANINSNEDSLKETCLKYGNLIDKVLLKMKNSKGKTKFCIKWTGGLDELRDFVSLVLKKSGDWTEANKKRSLVIFKTANLTITHYTSTSTLQSQENKASDSITYIKSLKDIHPKALASTSILEANINDSDALLNSSLDLSSESSDNSLMVANFDPETHMT